MPQRHLVIALSLLSFGCSTNSPAVDEHRVRIAVVNTPHYSGLMDSLLRGFEADSGLQVDIWSGTGVFDRATQGHADLVIAHFGKPELQAFVTSGRGHWPAMVFSNQAALVGPRTDPAGIRGLHDGSEALTRIAASSRFASNNLAGARFLESLLLETANDLTHQQTGWRIDTGTGAAGTASAANEAQAYFLWGALPFLRWQAQHETNLEILVHEDPSFQRVMSIVVVDDRHIPSANTAGAMRLRDWLLSAEVQSRVAGFRTPDFDGQLWWPAARHN